MDNGMVQIILSVIALLGTITTVLIAPWIRAKYSAEKRAEVMDYVEAGVLAAEQIFKVTDPTGKLRKQFVLKFLNDKGFKISEDEINILIEAAVKELNLIQNGLI